MDVEITRESEKLLCMLYKVYLDRRKSGEPRECARQFEDAFFSSAEPFASMNRDDVDDLLQELARKGMLKTFIVGDCELTDEAIVYLENRFKNGLISVISFLAQFA